MENDITNINSLYIIFHNKIVHQTCKMGCTSSQQAFVGGKVVITGVTGYLGSQVCQDFLKDGHFTVRGTVRDPTNEAKLAPLKKAFGDSYSKLEIVKADLLDAESLDKAIEGCDYVIHVASPFPISDPKDENELIKPAVEGTLNVLKAAHKHKVKRVVVTSSQVSVIMRKPENRKPIYNEEDWSELEYLDGYDKSKFLAEKAAWEFVKALPKAERFELSVVAPGLIVGPPIVNDDFTSGQYIVGFMTGAFP